MSRAARLTVVLVMNLALVAVLLVVGVTAHSLGVWAAGVDYLADSGAIGVSLLAIRLSRRPRTGARPPGHVRPTAVAAGVNGAWLLVLCVLVAGSAIGRLVGGVPEIHALPVVIASAIAAAVMAGGALILGGDVAGDDDVAGQLNIRAVLLDTVADAAAAAGVAAAGVVILATDGWYWLDPAVALAIAVVIGYHATGLLRDVAHALRVITPPGG